MDGTMTAPVREPAGSLEERPRRCFGDRRQELAGAAGLALVLALMSVLLLRNIADHPELSYLDEVAHGDYLFQASHGGMAQLGERLGPEIARERACRGVDLSPNPPDVTCPPVGRTVDLSRLPGWDRTNVDIHPPTYYYVTLGLAKAIMWAGATDDLISAGRFANSIWFGAGLILLYLLLRDLAVRVPARLATCLPIAVSPAMIQHMSLVSVTAVALPAGALLILAVVRWEQGRWNLAVLGLLSGACMALKADNLVPVFVACLYLLLRAVVLLRSDAPMPVPGRPDRLPRPGRGGDWRRYLLALLVTGVAAVLVEVVWMVIRNSVALGGPLSNPGTVLFLRHDLRLDDLVSQLPALTLPLGAIVPTVPLMAMTGFLLIAGPVAAVLYRRPADPLQTWGIAVLAGATLGGPLLVLGTYLSSSIIFPIPGRYGFGLVPAMAMLLAVGLGRRLGPAVLAGLVVAFLLIGPVTPPARTDGPAAARTPASAPATVPAPTAAPPASAPAS